MNAILISADEAAELLSMSRRRLLRLSKAGRIPHVDLGDGELRFAPDELREWAKRESAAKAATDAK